MINGLSKGLLEPALELTAGAGLKHATSLALHDYWQRCGARVGSAGRAIRASELVPILPSLFLIELDQLSVHPFRFCGAALAMRYGRDLTDESFLSLWSTEDKLSLKRDIGILANRGAGLVAGVLAETVGGGFTSFEMVLLPISGEGNPAGAIGSMERIGGHEEMNRIRARFVAQALRSVRFLPAAETLRSLANPALPAAGVLRHYRHLTVLQGGK